MAGHCGDDDLAAVKAKCDLAARSDARCGSDVFRDGDLPLGVDQHADTLSSRWDSEVQGVS